MKTRIPQNPVTLTPPPFEPQTFSDPVEAVKALQALYVRNTKFLTDAFARVSKGEDDGRRYRACYPEISLSIASYSQVDSRLSYGHVAAPGEFSTTVTRPDLFSTYFAEQLRQLIRNHEVPVTVSESSTPIPLHFAFPEGMHVEANGVAYR